MAGHETGWYGAACRPFACPASRAIVPREVIARVTVCRLGLNTVTDTTASRYRAGSIRSAADLAGYQVTVASARSSDPPPAAGTTAVSSSALKMPAGSERGW